MTLVHKGVTAAGNGLGPEGPGVTGGSQFLTVHGRDVVGQEHFDRFARDERTCRPVRDRKAVRRDTESPRLHPAHPAEDRKRSWFKVVASTGSLNSTTRGLSTGQARPFDDGCVATTLRSAVREVRPSQSGSFPFRFKGRQRRRNGPRQRACLRFDGPAERAHRTDCHRLVARGPPTWTPP